MCIFSGDVEVAGTQIFARLSGRGTQYLVYQMHYEAKDHVAMVLPLPVALPAQEDSVRFINLQHLPEFFTTLNAAFPQPQTRSLSLGSSADDEALLDVHDVGDFVASFVPAPRDFSRLDPRFTLPDDVWARLPLYHDYGFAVFQLKELEGRPHPMAFEFTTRLDKTLFFPTVHIHDGQVNEAEEFQHQLYFQGEAAQGELSLSSLGRYFRTEQVGEVLDLNSPARKLLLHGFLLNRDTLITLGAGGA